MNHWASITKQICDFPKLKDYWYQRLVTLLSLTLCDPMDCSPPGSSLHGIHHARILKRVAIFFSRGFSWPRDWTWISCTADRFFTLWATREAPNKYMHSPIRVCCFFLFSLLQHLIKNRWINKQSQSVHNRCIRRIIQFLSKTVINFKRKYSWFTIMC